MSRLGYFCATSGSKILFRWTVGTIRVLNPENCHLSSPFLLASNHISHFDPPALSAAFPRKIDWLAMGELFENPLSARFFRWLDTIPADRFNRDPKAVRTAINRLKMGRIVGIFPEGGLRSGATSVLGGAEMGSGAASIAIMAEVPILPCVILGSDRLYDPKAWRRWRSVTTWINFGKPLRANPDLAKGEARRELNDRLCRTLRALAAESKEAFGLTDDDLPTTAQHRKGRET